MTDPTTPTPEEETAAAPEDAEEAAIEAEPREPDAETAAPEGPAAEMAALQDKLMRAVAETENLRRRAAREREDIAKYAITGFARDLLPVVDNLRRALDSVPEAARRDESLAGLIEGIEMTEREILAAFERHGIRRIDPLGEKFDHNLHQAMFEVPGADAPDGTVVQVAQVGYTIADRLLRPAMVGVAKSAKPAASEHIDAKV